MLVRMKTDADKEQVFFVRKQLEDRSVVFRETVFFGQIVFVAMIPASNVQQDVQLFWASLLELPSVEEILVISPQVQGRTLTSLQAKRDRTKIEVGPLNIGNGHFGVIAGPCAVEDGASLLETAQAIKKAGATGLRGGAFKPRTSPYDFQGLREQGLATLAKREATGLPIVTEAMTAEEVPLVAQYADVIQIGTRNMQNYRLLEAVGSRNIPVLLKRGFGATLDEFLMAAEYILLGGNHRVILCERGIRTFETDTRFTLPLATIPILKRRTHLPIIVDPSHATGHYKFVPAMAAASVAAGADGLLIEVHADPQHAKCDGRQSLTFREFEQTIDLCRKIRALINNTSLISREDTGNETERVIPVPHRLESYQNVARTSI